MRRIVAGTRGSELAQIQTDLVIAELTRVYPDLEVEKRVIKTKGDKILDVPLAKIGDKGLFTKELENALFSGEIDFAVHSLKDLPVELPQGLKTTACIKREKPNDIVVLKHAKRLADLPDNAVIATGSLRRALQLKKIKPQIQIAEIRGNINTRLEKLANANWDGMVLAYCALSRLGKENLITELLPYEVMLPAVAQGIIAVESRDDSKSIELFSRINDKETESCGILERAFLFGLGGGCRVPMACNAYVEGSELHATGLYMPNDGEQYILETISGNMVDAYELGIQLAKQALSKVK
ncbi:MAG: hydroxymethylbilane synthase [Deltaproteobacteria bacterium]|nr:hydroxymethylbilane synthase [Deltaproteobacteria bacterium]